MSVQRTLVIGVVDDAFSFAGALVAIRGLLYRWASHD
jgi:hypothetical protein